MISVYPHGAAQTPQNLITSAAVDVSSGSAACGGRSGFPRTCTANVNVPGSRTTDDDFAFSTYDAAPASGSFSSAHLLGAGSLSNQTIVTGKPNSVVVFIGGVVSSLTGNPASASFPGDGTQHTLGIVIDPEDFGNNPITAGANDPFANPIVVSAAETGGSGHVTFSLNGGTPAARVTVSQSTDSVQMEYDGGGAPGYWATISLNAPAIGGAAGATESIQLLPLVLGSSNADYTAPKLALKGNGDELTMTIGEYGATPSTAYSATSSNCSAIADKDAVVGTGASASFHVYARATISTPPPGDGCSITVSDGTLTIHVAVSNAYSGIVGSSPIVTEYPTAVSNEEPQGITVGPDGAMWFAESASSSIGRIPATGTNPVASDAPLPLTNGTPQPVGIAPGPDGNLWWTDNSSSTVGNLTTAGVAVNYSTQSTSTNPLGIVQGPDGAMWFTECLENAIGRITTAGALSYPAITFATASYIVGITVGSDGNLWFTECGANKIGKITTAGVVTEIALPASSSDPNGITAGPDGALWFTECTGDKIGRIPTNATGPGDITEYATGITGRFPLYITTGPDGALWFTESGASVGGPLMGKYVIGRLDPDTKAITEYEVANRPNVIAAGPDGAVWFTESNASNIGRIAIQTSAALRHTGEAVSNTASVSKFGSTVSEMIVRRTEADAVPR